MDSVCRSAQIELLRLVEVTLVVQTQLCRLAQLHGVQVEPALAGRLGLLHRDAVAATAGPSGGSCALAGPIASARNISTTARAVTRTMGFMTHTS